MDASNRLEIPKRAAWLRIGRVAIPMFLGLVFLLVLGIYIRSSVPRDPLEIAYEKIEEGMPTEEAMAIVSRPEEVDDLLNWEPGKHWWWGDDACALEIQTSDGRVIKKELFFFRETFFDRLRRWVGW
jgi:hypothetical protein